MSEDTRRVLELLSQGKVSVQEAEQLLHAVASGEATDEKKAEPRYFRILHCLASRYEVGGVRGVVVSITMLSVSGPSATPGDRSSAPES